MCQIYHVESGNIDKVEKGFSLVFNTDKVLMALQKKWRIKCPGESTANTDPYRYKALLRTPYPMPQTIKAAHKPQSPGHGKDEKDKFMRGSLATLLPDDDTRLKDIQIISRHSGSRPKAQYRQVTKIILSGMINLLHSLPHIKHI